jgi:2,5-dioxopentanoate dehydrogenase
MTDFNINNTMEEANEAFSVFRKLSLKKRANFMRTIAQQIEALGDELLIVAGQETNLPEARLRGERGRTMFQLNAYADACERGNWLEVSIDTAIPDKMPPKPDLRKMLVPLGTVVVFGSSNFPFAYSTAGGDTASAFAAGCPVVVKAHPAHLQTGALMAKAIHKAIEICGLPKGVFANVYSPGFEIGKNLVMHPHTAAVGFTGSFTGGKQLFDWANQRTSPIPVFAEMTSINPIFLLPEKLNQSATELAKQIAGSITLGVGQFCTKPGILIAIVGSDLDLFTETLGNEIKNIAPATMLHSGIAKAYAEKSEIALNQENVAYIAKAEAEANENQGPAIVAKIEAKAFLSNPTLHQEVFGPYSLVIVCKNLDEMLQVAKSLEGQLTITLMATENDVITHPKLVAIAETRCGRFILNNVPTGVEVCLSMQHGGPFPSSTDSRFGSVGADAIKRFARPLSYQNWPNSLLPDELKNENPLHIWRTINDEITKNQV